MRECAPPRLAKVHCAEDARESLHEFNFRCLMAARTANDLRRSKRRAGVCSGQSTKMLIRRCERDFILKGLFHTERQKVRLIPRLL